MVFPEGMCATSSVFVYMLLCVVCTRKEQHLIFEYNFDFGLCAWCRSG